ncbi:CubicO group peptidase, beta-lactamase class C family [Evansella caseinilytica]|uniref:CubicO group peptidase, beta-lactamase class C family n=1 Tax=Evansella caseinilytica TaxID=1503961 RepID=A0A1H3R2U2_9BACI|nr:serine hydrolase [Evansella caseinilytica]SDZ19833.1 CubicO group peptidase, beta-lactamase class C family [Evansella caseinilytica]
MVSKPTIHEILKHLCHEIDFSGVILAKKGAEVMIQSAHGHADRANERQNLLNTRFGIASGCKLFTAIAVSQLVEKGVLRFDTKLHDCLDIPFPHFSDEITIHHLLTHTSGIPDYFDEAVMDDFEDLWKERPMYLIDSLTDFLPMFQHQKMMFRPGERFHYNNAGFIVLGLIIEQQTGMPFADYIEASIFQPCGMTDSGYFLLNRLPKNTAYGYIDKEEDGTWRTNCYSIPVKGGADGGAFVTAEDMVRLWDGLMSHRLLSRKNTELLLTPHASVEDGEFYGYGVWISKKNNEIYKYHVMGYDPGVSFHSAYYPAFGMVLVVPANKGYGAYEITKAVEEHLLI